jgi:hypothetical protein
MSGDTVLARQQRCQAFMRKKVKTASPVPTATIRQIRASISTIDLVCAGTLLKRWKVCGRPNCRCAKDPEARHGPYYEWSRRQDGRFLHSLLSPQQAETVTQAIADHQRILDLLATWREETRRILNIPNRLK